MTERITRRRFVGLGLAGLTAVSSGLSLSGLAAAADRGDARLRARPGKPGKGVKPGIRPLELSNGKGKSGLFSVPPGYDPAKPVPLMVMLHGALGRDKGFETFCRLAGEDGIAVLAPDSAGRTWDAILGGFGPDIEFLDRALAHTFSQLAVDPRRVALAGFSDGASYALSAGLPNGDLFTHLVPFSPGFMIPPSRKGKPSVWISHGTDDNILPVSASRDRIVPQLREWGYPVKYKEFKGGHDLGPDLAREAFAWFKKG